MYQFIHIETYSRHSKYNKRNPEKSKKSFDTVAREFMRHPDATPHVISPEPPKILYGTNAYEVSEIAKYRAEQARDAQGRKIRKDAQVVLSGVISCPREFKEENPEQYLDWERANIEYLQDKYGSSLESVISHNDEEHPHLHFLCVPEVSEDRAFHIKTIHEPIRVRDELKAGLKKNSEAYKQAFRELQDEYYENVACHFGFLRDGPKRKRLTRKEYQSKKAAARQQAYTLKEIEDQKFINDIEKYTQDMQSYFVQKEAEDLESRSALLNKEKAHWREEDKKLQQKEEKISAEEKALKEKQARQIETDGLYRNNLAILAIETEGVEKDIAFQKSEIDKNDEHINSQKKQSKALDKENTQLSDDINDKKAITESLKDEQSSLESKNRTIKGEIIVNENNYNLWLKKTYKEKDQVEDELKSLKEQQTMLQKVVDELSDKVLGLVVKFSRFVFSARIAKDKNMQRKTQDFLNQAAVNFMPMPESLKKRALHLLEENDLREEVEHNSKYKIGK